MGEHKDQPRRRGPVISRRGMGRALLAGGAGLAAAPLMARRAASTEASGPSGRFGGGHMNIKVSDLERSIAFYERLGFTIFIPAIPYLGLDRGPEPKPLADALAAAYGLPEGARGRAVIMQLGDTFPKIDLIQLEGADGAAPPTPPLNNADRGLVRICLISQDLVADVAHLKGEGVAFLSEPTSGHLELGDVAVCTDPDGTLIELLQVYLERWEAILNPGGGG
ncbi:MAG: VOC family protein [Pseudomonadota bacterium]